MKIVARALCWQKFQPHANHPLRDALAQSDGEGDRSFSVQCAQVTTLTLTRNEPTQYNPGRSDSIFRSSLWAGSELGELLFSVLIHSLAQLEARCCPCGDEASPRCHGSFRSHRPGLP